MHLVVQQNLDEQNLDVIPPFLDVEHLHLQDVVVDAEPHHLLKMDCYQDEVDAELRHLLKMDCYQGAVDAEVHHLLKMDCCQGAELLELLVLEPPALPMLLQMQPLPHLALPFQHRVMP